MLLGGRVVGGGEGMEGRLWNMICSSPLSDWLWVLLFWLGLRGSPSLLFLFFSPICWVLGLMKFAMLSSLLSSNLSFPKLKWVSERGLTQEGECTRVKLSACSPSAIGLGFYYLHLGINKNGRGRRDGPPSGPYKPLPSYFNSYIVNTKKNRKNPCTTICVSCSSYICEANSTLICPSQPYLNIRTKHRSWCRTWRRTFFIFIYLY